MKTKAKVTDKTRFDTRLSVQQKKLFEKAAELGGYGSLTDFILLTVQEKALEIIKDQKMIIASFEDSEIFFNAIMNPESPNQALIKAANNYNILANENS
jgi:uncharacterized protein (DUF1778 family)